MHVHRYPHLLLFVPALALAASACVLDLADPGESATEGTSASAGDTAATETSGGGETDTAGDGGPCDFPGDVQPIFTARCALGGCHQGASAILGLDLTDGVAHGELVGVASTSQPGTLLVAPGDPAASLLFLKLGPTPPVGQRMPVGGELSAAEVATIEAWIVAGAPASATFACAGGGGGAAGAVIVDPGAPLTLEVGALAALTASVTDGEGQPLPDAAVTWRSSDGLTLYVDGVGGLLGVSPGVATITAAVGEVTSEPIEIEVVDATPPAAGFAATLELLTARCAVAGCHVDGVEPGDLRFDRPADQVWDELVDDAAFQAPALRRVAPNAPRESYLVHKLALAAPLVGGRMPLGQPPLVAADVQLVLRWVLAGAPQG